MSVGGCVETRTCNRCGEEKSLDEFSKYGRGDSRRRTCKTCCNQANRAAISPAVRRGYNLSKRYGITKEDYLARLNEQGQVCAICGTGDPGTKHGWFCVDHDHETGEVRGILCFHCNAGLGQFKDNPNALIAAAFYLERGLIRHATAELFR